MCAQSVGGGVDFLACMDGASGGAKDKASTCAKSASLPWDKISSCFSGAQGSKLLTDAAKYFKQKFPGAVGVPHVEIAGKQVQDHSYASLLKALCATGIKAAACSETLLVV